MDATRSVDAERVRSEYRYNRLTWPEVNEAIDQQKVVILPTGSIGLHIELRRPFQRLPG